MCVSYEIDTICLSNKLE